jgi:hypothetical protein
VSGKCCGARKQIGNQHQAEADAENGKRSQIDAERACQALADTAKGGHARLYASD